VACHVRPFVDGNGRSPLQSGELTAIDYKSGLRLF
jgi:hypothetical protein